jgi:hypothetical protein
MRLPPAANTTCVAYALCTSGEARSKKAPKGFLLATLRHAGEALGLPGAGLQIFVAAVALEHAVFARVFDPVTVFVEGLPRAGRAMAFVYRKCRRLSYGCHSFNRFFGAFVFDLALHSWNLQTKNAYVALE